MGPYQIVSVLFRCTGQASFVSPLNHLLVSLSSAAECPALVSSSWVLISLSAVERCQSERAH